jgi:hypothetical protein
LPVSPPSAPGGRARSSGASIGGGQQEAEDGLDGALPQVPVAVPGRVTIRFGELLGRGPRHARGLKRAPRAVARDGRMELNPTATGGDVVAVKRQRFARRAGVGTGAWVVEVKP